MDLQTEVWPGLWPHTYNSLFFPMLSDKQADTPHTLPCSVLLLKGWINPTVRTWGGWRAKRREKRHNIRKSVSPRKEGTGTRCLSLLFHLMFRLCFCQQNISHLLVYGLRYHASSHGRQIAKVADSATICASCNKQHSKGNHAMFTPVLNGYDVIIMMTSLFFLCWTYCCFCSLFLLMNADVVRGPRCLWISFFLNISLKRENE